jgi:hypothetical protein
MKGIHLENSEQLYGPFRPLTIIINKKKYEDNKTVIPSSGNKLSDSSINIFSLFFTLHINARWDGTVGTAIWPLAG